MAENSTISIQDILRFHNSMIPNQDILWFHDSVIPIQDMLWFHNSMIPWFSNNNSMTPWFYNSSFCIQSCTSQETEWWDIFTLLTWYDFLFSQKKPRLPLPPSCTHPTAQWALQNSVKVYNQFCPCGSDQHMDKGGLFCLFGAPARVNAHTPLKNKLSISPPPWN